MMRENGLITKVGQVSTQAVSNQVTLLAEALALVHGEVIITRERSGSHIYLTCPECLQKEGKTAIQKKKLAVNADKHLGLGKWRNQVGTYDRDAVGYCMKNEVTYCVSQLLGMESIKKRGYPEVGTKTEIRSRERFLIDDGRGNMIPAHPGLVAPITQLPKDHVAVKYLLDRKYDLEVLEKQFRCGYCYQETPERYEPPKRFYRKMPGGWKDTPQGRIIFYAMVGGVQVAWQARIIERTVGNQKQFWHSYENRWVVVQAFVSGKWWLIPPYDAKPPF